MQDIFNIPEEIRRNMFLQVNPEISKLLNNDSSLKNICTTADLYGLDTRHMKTPSLYLPNDIVYDKNNICLETYMKFLLSLIVNNKLTGSLVYNNCSFSREQVVSMSNLMADAFEEVKGRYIEYFSSVYAIEIETNMSMMRNVVVRFELKVEITEHYTGALRDTFEFLKLCNYVIDELVRRRKLAYNMPQRMVAAILFNWVVLHTSYDTTFKKYSYTGFSALKYGYAVCQGFTALYNALCKICNIWIIGMTGKGRPAGSANYEDHIWSFAYLDGRYAYIDVTWGSPVFANEKKLREYGVSSRYFCDFTFFDMPYKEFVKSHIWKN